MAFKKTAEGRVFFQNLDQEEVAGTSSKPTKKSTPTSPRTTLRTGLSQAGSPQAGVAANQSQTQFQIIALLKTLNAKLQNTQAERDAMKNQLNHYESIVTRLEEKANITHGAYEQLTKSAKIKDKEMLAQSRRAEQIAQEAFTELAEARQLIMDLEEKADFSEKELKRHTSQRKKIEDDIATRHAEFEKFQKTLADHALTSKNLTKRLNKAEEQNETLDLQINNAVSRQEMLDRKLEKSVQERSRMLRKVDRIEEAVIQTRDAMNAKAMVLLTDQESAGGTEMPASWKDMDPESIQGLLHAQSSAAQKSVQDGLLPWWKNPVPLNPLGVASFVVLAVLAGWMVSEIQKPVMSDMEELKIFNDYEISRAKETTDSSALSGTQTMLSGLSEAGLEHAAKVKAAAEALMSKISNTTTKEVEETTESLNATLSVEPITQTLVKSSQPINDDIGTLDIHDEAAVLRALEKDPRALAKELNALEPSSKPVSKSSASAPYVHAQENAVLGTRDSSLLQAIPSAFSSNPDQYNKADPNLPEAVKPIQEKALSGKGDAQHDLAAIYTAGHGGVQQDYKRAAYWFEKSAKNGVANAAYNLGVLYHQGLGIKADLPMAVNWYKAAADLGHPEAQYNLGIAHIEGVGVEYNPGKATAYFESAANNNVVEAAYNLGLIYENGLLGEAKPDEAIMWYKMGADQGSPEARQALQQLAKGLNIGIEDVNRLADSMNAAKKNH